MFPFILTSSTSCVILTCFVGYLIFYHIKVPQVIKQSTHCEYLIETIKIGISVAIFGVPERKSPMDTTRKILEDSKTITKQEF
jgi:hypothetical protein